MVKTVSTKLKLSFLIRCLYLTLFRMGFFGILQPGGGRGRILLALRILRLIALRSPSVFVDKLIAKESKALRAFLEK